MYQALYRKYRPNNFENVVGQDIIIRTLKNAINNDKISHAYLFTGPRGTGKTTIAKILAKTVNCTDVKNAVSCNVCVNCTQFNQKTSTDIIEIDAASNNGVDEIREIRNKVNLVPSVGKYKIYIIDEVHMLSQGAFNALLKTLEEPPAHVIFILATTEPHKIPATILSRCQKFDFKKISSNSILERLKYICNEEKIEIEEEALKAIATSSDGGMRDSISLLDQVISYNEDNIKIDDVYKVNGTLSLDNKYDFIKNIIEKDICSILNKIDEYNNEGKNLIKIIEDIANTLKNILLVKISEDYRKKYFLENEKFKKSIDEINYEEVLNLANEFNNNLINIKTANDPKLAIELLMIKKCCSEKDNEKTEKIIEQKKEKEEKNKKEETKIETKKDDLEEKKEQKTEKNNLDENKIKIEEIQKIRIENTLARFQKNILKELKSKTQNLDDFIADEKYSKIASLIADGELKAASDEYLLYVFDSNGLSNKFNENLIEVEMLVEKIFGKKYRAISTNNISWEIIKKEFNSKERDYLYVVEDFDLNQKNNQSELVDCFENIIEYE